MPEKTYTQRFGDATVTITGNGSMYMRLTRMISGLLDGDAYETARAAAGICANLGTIGEEWKDAPLTRNQEAPRD